MSTSDDCRTSKSGAYWKHGKNPAVTKLECHEASVQTIKQWKQIVDLE